MSWSGRADDSVKAAQDLLARAQAGDQAAAQQLHAAASSGGWAPNHRVAAQQAWNEYTPGTEGDVALMKNPHKGLAGVLGSALKFAAPLAGLIPGIGIPLGAGMAAGGSALGGVLSGDKFDLGSTLMAGAAGGVGGALNPLGHHGGSSPSASPARGNATQSMAPIDPGMSGNPQGGGFLKDLLGDGSLVDKGMQAAGMFGAIDAQHSANEMQKNAIGGATRDYAGRQPLRTAAQSGILGLGNIQAPDMSAVFADPGNFYARSAPRPLTAKYRGGP